MPINGVGVTAAVIGLGFAYAGIKGVSISNVARDFVTGATGAGQDTPISLNTGSATPDIVPNTTDPGGDANTNRAIGKVLAAQYGWSTGDEWTALDNVFTKESGWQNTVRGPATPDGTAYGIAQALPETKYPAAGQSTGGSSASVQISWGLEYIKQRYGDPIAAWAHEQQNNWY